MHNIEKRSLKYRISSGGKRNIVDYPVAKTALQEIIPTSANYPCNVMLTIRTYIAQLQKN